MISGTNFDIWLMFCIFVYQFCDFLIILGGGRLQGRLPGGITEARRVARRRDERREDSDEGP